MQTKGVQFMPDQEVADLAARNGRVVSGIAEGRPSLDKDTKAIEMSLALSGTTNGRLATQGFEHMEQRTGTRLADLAAEAEAVRVTFTDAQARPTSVVTSPEWSGSETGGRRYTAFSTNVERLKPWHTLTGRMHSTSTTTGWRRWARRSRSTAHRWTCTASTATRSRGTPRPAGTRGPPGTRRWPCATSPRTRSG